MNTVEDRLREALAERARHAPINPDAWDKTVARVRRRTPGSFGSRFFIPAAAAAAVIVIIAGSAALIGHGGQRGGRAAAPASATPPPPPGRGDYGIQQVPPVSAIVPVQTSLGGRTSWTFVWFGYDKHDRAQGIELCSSTYTGRTFQGGGCGPAQVPAGRVAAGSGGLGSIRLGVSTAKVASVAARLTNGRMVPGTLVSGRGFPYRVWAVSYPLPWTATIVFHDRAGHQAGQLFIPGSPPPPHQPGHGGIVVFTYPAGTVEPQAGTMTAYLLDGVPGIPGKVVGFWGSGGSSAVSNVPVSRSPAVVNFGSGSTSPHARQAYFYGYAHENVARVALRLAGGAEYGAQTFAAWPGSGVRLWAFAVPSPPSPRSRQAIAVLLGYDAAGRVVWQQRIGVG